MLPRWKEYVELLKESEKRSPEHLFKEWQDWYGFGSMMNLPMNRLETEYEIDSNDKYAVLQKDF